MISSFAVVLNIALNAVFIFGLFGVPRLEIAGAASATVIARGVELVVPSGNGQKGSVKFRFRYALYTATHCFGGFLEIYASCFGK